ncbi:putative mitochondrial DNA polymerase beta-PAK [Trypanosoma cruzi]|uniref:DNA polymerase n=2 Tax=Trypanosoma cruzi TaxID=5693 RepID=V5B1F6_TRYCR|nr:mitochondrial DNA polymerase beta-PAK [Trypanosoma cruzi Dm28c]PBJ75947.1 mitochondrial DNA polymerase beta-PAK [Trypanosoma cruzi cruzi]RNF15409.1 putative mitochondrial DNA polymerase beta-PAK [Trypanosoma cruzi]
MMLLRATRLLRVSKRTVVSTGAQGAVKRATTTAAAPVAESTTLREARAAAATKAAGQRKPLHHSRGGSGDSTRPVTSLQASAQLKGVRTISKASSFVPDHREKVLQIFQRLAEINNALQERYKAQSYQIAVDNLKRDDFIFVHLPPNILPPGVDDAKRTEQLNAVSATPVVGEKLKAKIVEILSMGDLAELHSLQAKPIIRAIQELTQVHGVGPRTAVTFYKKYGIKSVAELQQRVKDHEAEKGIGDGDRDGSNCGNSGGAKKGSKKTSAGNDDPVLHLTEAQRLGLKYHRDIMQRIPYEEVRLHEAFLKLRLRKYLGKGYELSICGSYRRRQPTSGDIDVLITRKMNGKGPVIRRTKSKKGGQHHSDEQVLAPQEVLAAFVEALKRERYIEATLAQGATKFMGVSRLRSYNYNAGATSPKLYPARRLDIRFVEPECFPAALLYFTGSKHFNVVMRAEAIKQNFVLNEYGLFHNDAAATVAAAAEDNAVDGSSSCGSGSSGGNSKNKPNNNNSNNGGGSNTARGRWNAEAFQKLVRAQYYSAKSPAFMGDDDGRGEEDDDGEDGADGAGEDTRSKKHGKKVSAARQRQQQQELAALWREVESRRVKVKHERDIFDALGMTYVQPEQREM